MNRRIVISGLILCIASGVIYASLATASKKVEASNAAIADGPIHSAVEFGPVRQRFQKQGERNVSSIIVATRSSVAGKPAAFFIRVDIDSASYVLSLDVASDFVAFAKQVESKHQDLKPSDPISHTNFLWSVSGGPTFSCNTEKKSWKTDNDIQMKDLIEDFEAAIKDAEAMKAIKPKTPW